jgi:N-acylglucosamine 2-epimerase
MYFNNFENQIPEKQRKSLRDFYHSTLFDNFVPWWEAHSIDKEYGGYFTRLERDGHPYSYDKDMWMTGRAIWMFSHLYNNYKPEPKWRDYAKHGLDFMLKHAFRDDRKMYFRLDRKGNPLATVLSLYTEVFASIAVAEFCKIEQSDDLKQLAMDMYDRMMLRLGKPEDTPLLGYPINAQFHLHAHDMVRLTVAWVYNDIWPDRKFEEDIDLSWKSIIKRHWKPECRVLFENVAMDGSLMLDLPEGRMFHPGHSIESAWMMMEVAEKTANKELLSACIDILLASLEHGWDKEFCGLRYITNFDWTPPHNLEADLKLWWPHGETLYALLFAWAKTGRNDLKEWYQKVHDYAFSKFPDNEYGEWFGYLNRDGSRVWTAKANGWKGFFHVPRILFRCYKLLS